MTSVNGSGDQGDQQVRLVIVGHVDHGKSTLIGRLFHDTDSLPEGKYEQLAEAARRRGTVFEWANLMDGLQAERDQNVTIDTAQIWFRARGRQYVLIDAPGHKEFLKNMVTGAAAADAGVVLIDALEGVQEQSRRHGYLLKLLGVGQVIVAVNKMDLVDFDRAVFERVACEYRAFLDSIGLSPLEMLPISAKNGDNVAGTSERLAWFQGPTFVQSLARFVPRVRATEKPFRLPVQDVYRFDHRRIVAGRVESGVVRAGERLVFLPGGKQSTVKSIEIWNGDQPGQAGAGAAIGVTLTEQLFLERGAVACAEGAPALEDTAFRAKVFWLGRRPLVPGRTYRLKLTTQEMDCEIAAIDRVIDGATLAEITKDDPSVDRNEIAELTVRTRRPVVFDRYDDIPALGRFVLVDGFDVAGGGVILDRADGAVREAPAGSPVLVRSVGHVSQEERHGVNRHRGAVVWFTGLSGSGKSTLANSLEREFFDRGLQVFVLDGDNLRFGLNRDLGFTAEDRTENIRRVAEVAKLFAEAGMIAMTAFISPYRSDRLRARRIMGEGGVAIPFIEVHLDVALDVCEQRDPKGLYAKARAGQIKQFTGISDPYEPPEHAEITLRTGERSIAECVTTLLDRLLPQLLPR